VSARQNTKIVKKLKTKRCNI